MTRRGARVVDLGRVRAATAALAATVAAHPELKHPKGRARLAAWLEVEANDEDDEGSMRKMSDEERLNKAFGIRLSDEDAARLDALTARVRVASRHAVARAALLIGLEALEADPSRLFAPEPAVPKTSASKAQRTRAATKTTTTTPKRTTTAKKR